jgi:hypothetical protein
MAAAPMAAPARSMTSTVRLAQLQRPITQVFANRPMWVAPERKHWAVEASHANMYLSLGVGIVGTCALAQIIVAKMGGGKYGALLCADSGVAVPRVFRDGPAAGGANTVLPLLREPEDRHEGVGGRNGEEKDGQDTHLLGNQGGAKR